MPRSKRWETAEDYDNPRYSELLIGHHYVEHILRMPVEEWPDPINRTLDHVNNDIYIPLQGPSELGASGKLVNWDRTLDLGKIRVPTLVIGAKHDSMDPDHMEWMSYQVQDGRYLYCPNGSHFAQYDDAQTYFPGLIQFIDEVDSSDVS